MEGLHDKFAAPNPPTEVSRRSINNQNMDPSFISLSFITDDDMLEELNTVNETILDDYSQTSTAILSNSHESEVSQLVTRIAESPTMSRLLTSQLENEPDSNIQLSKPSPNMSPSDDAELIEDDDVLPPSPVPPNQPRRTPGGAPRSSAFVTMAVGSPVQGSLRTLRNIEEVATSTVPDKSDSPTEVDKGNAKAESNVAPLGSSSKTKSMRQINFESDSGSSHSNRDIVESPSSFLLEPSRDIPKPTVSRLVETVEDDDDGIEFVGMVKHREGCPSPQSSISAAQPKREADSASQNLTPRLTSSQASTTYSQDLLSKSPLRDPDSQSHRLIECFQTQDLIAQTANETIDQHLDTSSEHVDSKLELSVETQPYPTFSIVESAITPNRAMQPTQDEMVKGSNDTTEQISSEENTPETTTEEWALFEAVTRVYNPLQRAWVLRTFNKMLPLSKIDVAVTGSVADQVRMGLFDNMDSETLHGSRLESFAELLQRHVNLSTSSYNADISGSSKSDMASLRISRLSIASNFETAPIACSSLLSRASMESQIGASNGEFVVPKHPPMRQKANRLNNTDSLNNPVASSRDDGPLPSHISSDADSTDLVAHQSPDECQEEASATAPFTLLKVGRKRGRKPKIPDAIKENESSVVATPPKKGRRGRPPGSGTPVDASKNGGNSAGKERKNGEPPQEAQGATSSGAAANTGDVASDDKSSEDYLKEAEEAWRDLRNRSYEVGKDVFAQWTDKCYYAAKIIKRDPVQTGKWTVRFEDGQSRSLVEEFILPVSLLNKNQSVLVLNENLSEGRPGVVIGYSKNKAADEMEHLVEMDGRETIKVSRRRICLTQDQMKQWSDSIVVQQLFSPHTCNVSLDNILGGKRRRATTSELAAASPHEAEKTPRTPRTPRSRSETPAVAPDQSPKSSRLGQTPSVSLRKKIIGKRDIMMDTSTMSESSGASMLLHEETSLRMRIISRIQGQSPPSVIEEEEGAVAQEKVEDVDTKITGPLPENDKLFAGFAFILTKANRPLEVDPEDVTDELEPYLNPRSYYKEHIRHQLTAGGGVVLERFDLAQFQSEENTVLVVCNRPCRTERYIRSLAANIRAVSHEWVYECCRKNELLNYKRYLLPPGIDLRGNIVEWSVSTGRCFVGTRILLQGPPEFSDLWIPILVQAECVIVSRMPAKVPGGNNGDIKVLCDDVPFDYVVTTSDCPSKIVEQARRMKIPIVSSLWIMQSLIHGKILDPSSSPEFVPTL